MILLCMAYTALGLAVRQLWFIYNTNSISELRLIMAHTTKDMYIHESTSRRLEDISHLGV